MSHELVEAFHQFYRAYYDDRESGHTPILELANKYPKEQRSLEIDFADLYRFDPALADDFLNQPEQILRYAEEALRTYDIPIDVSLSADVRVKNLEALPDDHVYHVGQYSIEEQGKYTAIQGQVNKVAESKGKLTEAAFECTLCGTLNRVPQTAMGFQEPHECNGCERQGPFRINWEQSEGTDYQLVRLQLPPEHSRGGKSAEIDIEFTGPDMVDRAAPGDRVTIGTRLMPEVDDEDKATFVLTGEANNIEHQEADYEDLDLDEWEDEILEIGNSQDPHEKVVASIKPSHMGDENIKQAIALQMFGGVKKEHDDGSVTRGNSHILLMGDPGTDKSGLLEYACDLSPRSVYTSGQSASKAGLTCAAVQDDFGDGGWTIEGGALVKAHKGLCAIDEFDKMEQSDQSGVMEAMSQGTISPAKADISGVTLPADTNVLAGANPEYGRFDDYEPIAQQIDLPAPLISRFDLIFTMADKPDQERDAKLAEHINQAAYVAGMKQAGKRVTAEESADIEPEIDPDLLRRYIAYAKKNLTPTLSKEARDAFKEFYTSIRASADEDSPVPVTARKLESLHRLGEASARIRLSETVNLEDAERVIAVVMDCLNDVGIDPETGEFDADVIETGNPKSQKDRMSDLKEVISDLELEYDEGAPKDIVKERMADLGHTTMRVKHALAKLMDKGEVYEPSDGNLRTT